MIIGCDINEYVALSSNERKTRDRKIWNRLEMLRSTWQESVGNRRVGRKVAARPAQTKLCFARINCACWRLVGTLSQANPALPGWGALL